MGRRSQARNAASTLLVAGRSDRPLGPGDQTVIDRAAAAVGRSADVLDVRDQGLSRDGRARRALVELRDSGKAFGANADQLFNGLRADLASVRPPGGLGVHFAGQLASTSDQAKQDRRTRGLTSLLSIVFIIALLLVVFRALLAPIITLVPAALALIVAGPLIAEASKAGVQVSGLLSILLTVIMLGAGTDYGLFLIFRVREEIAQGASGRAAVTHSLSRVGETITFSAACVMLALLSLLLAKFGFYRGLGPGLAIGVAMVLLAGLTLLPALLAVFGSAAFWPRRPEPGHQYAGAWGRVAARVVGRPALTLAGGVALFIALSLAALGYRPSGFDSEQTVSGSDSAAGEALVQAHFPAAFANPTNVLFRLRTSAWSEPRVLAGAARELAAAGPFATVTGAVDSGAGGLQPAMLAALHRRLGPPQMLRGTPPAGVPAAAFAAYRATSQFVSADGRTIQLYASLRAGDPGSAAAVRSVPAVRRAVASTAASIGATDSGVAGEAPVAYDVSRVSSSDLRRVVPVVLVVIAVLLALLLRSLVAPLYLIVSVGLSYLAAFGLAVVIFMGLGGQAGLNFVLPFFLFVFLMALGSDYNILVMTRIREEAEGSPLREAVRRAIAATGGTVTSAGLVLAGTFAVLTVAGSGQARQIGLGLAAGILLDTFLVRTLLIPSVVVLVGRHNWWPSRLAREAPADG